MDDLVKYLVKCEEEAKDKIEKSMIFKEQLRKQAIHDSEKELKLLELEYDREIEMVKSKHMNDLQELRRLLEFEFKGLQERHKEVNYEDQIQELVEIIAKDISSSIN